MGRMRQFGNVIDFSETPGLVHGPAPQHGQHTQEILGWLGYGDDDIQKLKDDGVVTWPGDDYRWLL
jgi:alpha-methylacyl-CoA racemase